MTLTKRIVDALEIKFRDKVVYLNEDTKELTILKVNDDDALFNFLSSRDFPKFQLVIGYPLTKERSKQHILTWFNVEDDLTGLSEFLTEFPRYNYKDKIRALTVPPLSESMNVNAFLAYCTKRLCIDYSLNEPMWLTTCNYKAKELYATNPRLLNKKNPQLDKLGEEFNILVEVGSLKRI